MDIDLKKSRVATVSFFLKGYIHIVYKKLIEPRKTDEEERRVEFILNVILLGTAIFLTFLECLLLVYRFIWPIYYNIPYSGVSIVLFSTIYLLSLSFIWMSRSGYVKLASYCLIAFYFIGTTYSAFIWGPYLYQVILTYTLLIVIGSILLSARVGFFLTVLIGLANIVSSILHLNGFVTFNETWKDTPVQLSDAVKFSVTYGMIMLISWLSNREIAKSLSRAHASEHALRERNESLEIIVEERTRALRVAQEEKVAQLSHFAEFGKLSSGIFHDLINPLSVAALHIERLGTSSSVDVAEAKIYVDRAVSASRRMETLLGSVRKQIAVDKSESDFLLDKEIREALSLLSYKAMQAKVSIRFKARRSIRMWGNTAKFHQIITNLVSNAIDACDDPKIPQEQRVVSVILRKQYASAFITIKDKGCGIPSEYIDKIFDPFFTTKAQHKGMGLGLATTKACVEKDFHGTISVKSQPNEGTIFTILLPLNKTHE